MTSLHQSKRESFRDAGNGICGCVSRCGDDGDGDGPGVCAGLPLPQPTGGPWATDTYGDPMPGAFDD